MMETIPCRPTNASSHGSSWAADGFTLIEVVVALLILAVGILGAASMQITAIKGNGTAYKITEASMVASERAEQLLALDFGSADLADGSEKVNGFGVEWVVVSPTTDPDRRDITVTVAWKEGDRAHSFDYRFLKARGI